MEDNNIENYTRSLRYYLSKIMMELKPEDVVLDVYCYITQSNVEESYFVAQKIIALCQ